MTTPFLNRRHQLLAKLSPKSVVILGSSPVKVRNGDTHYPYRQHSDFYYLTGCEEPQAIALLSSDENEFILFSQERDLVREQWEGKRLGQEGVKLQLGADRAYSIKQFSALLGELISGKERIYCFFNDRILLRKIQKALLNLQRLVRSGIKAPAELHNLSPLVHEMRLIKDSHEVELMRKAAQISAKAHRVAMSVCKPRMKEYELQAALEYELSRHGCRALAYPSIVAGGANACVLHYTANNAELKSGDLVLLDAGGEYENYAADITRTYPVSGKFTEEQRAIYELVLKTQEKVIATIKPGVKRDVMQNISEREITQGLIELGILKGSLEDLLAAQAFQPFYMHRIGHWLGLDVHDVGDYKINKEWRELKAGMVLTIEPGIYISPECTNVDARWRGIGVRIEDDILVTQEGCEVLSSAAPKSVVEIEKIMATRKAD